MKIRYPIIVEGKYDKIKLDSIIEANVFTTNGFEIFSRSEKMALIKKMAEISPVILLTDSDSGGNIIRSYIKSCVPADRLINLYIPRVYGKEKRKKTSSKEGVLGVEGIDGEELVRILSPFSESADCKKVGGITKSDLYFYGLSGKEDSKRKRSAFLNSISLPDNMSPNSMLCALNILFSREEFIESINKYGF